MRDAGHVLFAVWIAFLLLQGQKRISGYAQVALLYGVDFGCCRDSGLGWSE
jgi:hypothetical protein